MAPWGGTGVVQANDAPDASAIATFEPEGRGKPAGVEAPALAELELPATGGALLLAHATTALPLDLTVERRGAAALLARPGAPYARLAHARGQAGEGARVRAKVDVSVGAALWVLRRQAAVRGTDSRTDDRGRAAAAGAVVSTNGDSDGEAASLIELRPACNESLALAYGADGALRLAAAGSSGAAFVLREQEATPSLHSLNGAAASPALAVLDRPLAGHRARPMVDIVELAASYARDGFVVVPACVPMAKVSGALRLLNHFLGSAKISEDLEVDVIGSEYEDNPQAKVKLGSGHRCTCSLAQHEALRALTGCEEVRRVAAAAVGGEVCRKPWGCQVALRYPLYPSQDCAGDEALAPLLERIDWHTDAEAYNAAKKLDFVVGVFLNDLNTPGDAPLWVRPGSHLRTSAADRQGAKEEWCADIAPVPVLGEAGMAIVFHPWLLHGGGPNLGSSIRYAVYSRLRLAER